MLKGKLEHVNFKQFEDEYGNLKNEFEVIVYYKDTNNKWIKNEKFESGRSYYIVDGKLYFRLDNTLIPCNMDFSSETCGACYQAGDTVNNLKITGNDILFTVPTYENELSLHKQSYSDGTCFYTLCDRNKIWKTGYGSKDLKEIIKQLIYEIEVHSYMEKENFFKESPEMQEVYYTNKTAKEDVINKLLYLV